MSHPDPTKDLAAQPQAEGAPLCGSEADDEATYRIREAREAGRREGLEEAARACELWADRFAADDPWARNGGPLHGCADRIRALAAAPRSENYTKKCAFPGCYLKRSEHQDHALHAFRDR